MFFGYVDAKSRLRLATGYPVHLNASSSPAAPPTRAEDGADAHVLGLRGPFSPLRGNVNRSTLGPDAAGHGKSVHTPQLLAQANPTEDQINDLRGSECRVNR